MSSPIFPDFDAPANRTRSGAVVGIGPAQRLQIAMRHTADDIPTPEPGDRWSYQGPGVPNPFGAGIHAYEPNNVIFDAYAKAYGEVKAQEEAAAQATTETGSVAPGGTQPIDGTGKVATMVRNALALAQRAVPYVWGGTTANGVDCSGLIYYAAQSAGLDLPRYRAIDYAKLGVGVTLDQARPGDVVYYDNPGTSTDHVGIYLGNGQVVQAPTTGDHVRVTSVGKFTSIRRIFDDQAFGEVATPGGGSQLAYGGSPYDAVVGSANTGMLGRGGLTAGLGSTITRPPSTGTGGRTRAI